MSREWAKIGTGILFVQRIQNLLQVGGIQIAGGDGMGWSLADCWRLPETNSLQVANPLKMRGRFPWKFGDSDWNPPIFRGDENVSF